MDDTITNCFMLSVNIWIKTSTFNCNKNLCWQICSISQYRVSFSMTYVYWLNSHDNNFYRPQRSCGQGYVFTRVCDSVNTGGCLPQCMLGYHPLPRSRPPRNRHPPPGADTGIRSMSGRYASYWNAFLLLWTFSRFCSNLQDYLVILSILNISKNLSYLRLIIAVQSQLHWP